MKAQRADPAAGRLITERVRNLPVFRSARRIGAYMPLPGEPDIRPLFALPDRRFFIPAFDEAAGAYRLAALTADLRPGRFGIPEPSAPDWAGHLDLILVPGNAFDRTGNRLGRGGGFYDRILAQYPGAVPVGLCFDCRVVDSLPVEPHDRAVAWIITESQVLGPL